MVISRINILGKFSVALDVKHIKRGLRLDNGERVWMHSRGQRENLV